MCFDLGKPSLISLHFIGLAQATSQYHRAETRMHSSRMRTGRSLTVWRGGPPWGVSSCPGGSPCRGVLPVTPPVNRMTNRCKNITLATTSLRPVHIHESILVRKIWWNAIFQLPSSPLKEDPKSPSPPGSIFGVGYSW